MLQPSPASAPAPPIEAAPPLHAWDQELYEALIKDSPIKSKRAKETLAETVVTLILQLRVLRCFIEAGKATGEEHRAASGIASNLRRALSDLGVTAQKRADEEDL